jgi:hypothetical protein
MRRDSLARATRSRVTSITADSARVSRVLAADGLIVVFLAMH